MKNFEGMSAQDILTEEFLEDDTHDSNETLELFKFMRDSGVALTEDQLKASFLLNESGLSDISELMIINKRRVTDNKVYFKLLDKLTMADRIKGNAKLSHLMKANANPAESLKPADLQAQQMTRREIDRY